jgi:hypothetical protein
MKQSAVEFLLRELKKYGDTCPNYEINYVIEIPTHILTELEGQAKEMEKEEKIEFAKMHVKIALKAVENEMILQASSVKYWYLPQNIK